MKQAPRPGASRRGFFQIGAAIASAIGAAEARRRIEQEPDRYVPHIYGVDEVGGTSWLFLSDVPFDKLGFARVASEPPAYRTRAWMRLVPGLAAGMAGLLTGAYLLEGRNGGDGKAQDSDHPAQGGERQ
ncbi:hypothetical protein [Geochorda subterranea]|uniref:Secreted protein n=1 Tax=Geochorda subterranea TaxID=3109564 RepID=A0ABZ1BSI1_9FIRM|nr:hypothetical protein [Limnochorda sp. LNt]WRP15744.1 hypothetical protein VLY81_06210 [Limnochorda sp. LNt]